MEQRFRRARPGFTARPVPVHPVRSRRIMPFLLVAGVGLVLLGWLLFSWLHHTPATPAVSTQRVAGTEHAATQAAPLPKPNHCADTDDAKVILISISQRHLWACADRKEQYDSAVVTGMENLPADLTPRGTFHIYSKQTNLYLTGSDSTGSWHDFVYYWMPFLTNQYGEYGFHDATWRKDGDFGRIDPYSSDASHGCVELPLTTAKWLYAWAVVGTTVVIKT
jgi:lipoprotein-anchoring transpeptidase ErfK/SrfK